MWRTKYPNNEWHTQSGASWKDESKSNGAKRIEWKTEVDCSVSNQNNRDKMNNKNLLETWIGCEHDSLHHFKIFEWYSCE